MLLSYRDYPAEVTLDLEEGIVSGRVLGVETPITFCAERVDEVEVRLAEAVDDYLRSCAERGEEPERPYSGHVEFYTSPEAHGRLVAAAARSGLSLGAWLDQVSAAAAAAALSRTSAA
jgi:predicted HicB family RNase H-like nuclease